MKTKQIIFAATVILCCGQIPLMAQGSIGIGTTNPSASAALDVVSTTKGFLPPRMTLTQRNAINTPAPGLTIYNTTSNCLETWDGSIWFGPCNIEVAQYPGGSVFCGGKVTKVVPVLNPTTGKIWMDRNLGADRAATSSTDDQSYGSLFQWGRGADGHQCVNRYSGDGVTTSVTNITLSGTDSPGHGYFITIDNNPYDWHSPKNDNLWQGVNGVNNPCPGGYRLPTDAEWLSERDSWGSENYSAAGALASPLKLPMAGTRANSSGLLYHVGTYGIYWSSTVSSTYSKDISFNSSIAYIDTYHRAEGYSVRCIKD